MYEDDLLTVRWVYLDGTEQVVVLAAPNRPRRCPHCATPIILALPPPTAALPVSQTS